MAILVGEWGLGGFGRWALGILAGLSCVAAGDFVAPGLHRLVELAFGRHLASLGGSQSKHVRSCEQVASFVIHGFIFLVENLFIYNFLMCAKTSRPGGLHDRDGEG